MARRSGHMHVLAVRPAKATRPSILKGKKRKATEISNVADGITSGSTSTASTETVCLVRKRCRRKTHPSECLWVARPSGQEPI